MAISILEYILWGLLVVAAIANVVSWQRGAFLGLANIALILLIYISITALQQARGAEHLHLSNHRTAGLLARPFAFCRLRSTLWAGPYGGVHA